MSLFINQLNAAASIAEDDLLLLEDKSDNETKKVLISTLRASIAGVKTVNSVTPDGAGNINLTPTNISDAASAKKFATAAQLANADLIQSGGGGTSFLADDGTYKAISIPSVGFSDLGGVARDSADLDAELNLKLDISDNYLSLDPEGSAFLTPLKTNVDIQAPGQITVTNGSNAWATVGGDIGTYSDPSSVAYWAQLWLKDSAGDWYMGTIGYTGESLTSGTFVDVFNRDGMKNANMGNAGVSTTFQGVSGTYDYYALKNFSNGNLSYSHGNNTYAENYGFSFGGLVAATGQTALAHGRFSAAKGSQSFASGLEAFALGDYSKAFGQRVWSSGAQSFAGGKGFRTIYYTDATYDDKYVKAQGATSFNFSENTTAQTVDHGAQGANSAILGGINHDIPSDSPRAAIIGGNAIKARAADPDQVYVPNFNIVTTVDPGAGHQYYDLTREESTGKVNSVRRIVHHGVSQMSTANVNLKGPGQITVTNSSTAIVGIGTNFNDSTPTGINYWQNIWLKDSANNWYRAGGWSKSSATAANCTKWWGSAEILGGYETTLTTYPGVTGTYDYYIVYNYSDNYSVALGNQAFANNFSTAIGSNTVASGSGSFAGGQTALASAIQAWSWGNVIKATGSYSVSHGKGYNVGATYRYLIASGSVSVNMSENTASQTSGHGALAANSVILGGRDHNIPSDSPRSVILGGNAIKADAALADMVYVPNLRIVNGKLRIVGIPTSSAGLSAGDVWSNAGVLTIV